MKYAPVTPVRNEKEMKPISMTFSGVLAPQKRATSPPQLAPEENLPTKKRRLTEAQSQTRLHSIPTERDAVEEVVTDDGWQDRAGETEKRQKLEEDVPGEDDECLGCLMDATRLETEGKVLDMWIETLKISQSCKLFIARKQLVPLLENIALLAVHLPRNSVVRAVHDPGRPFALKLSLPSTGCSDPGNSLNLPSYLFRKDSVPIATSSTTHLSDSRKENVANSFALDRDSVRDYPPFQKLLAVIQADDSDKENSSSQPPARHSSLEGRRNDIQNGHVHPFETLLQASSFCL
jgi:hypothetical protein